MLVCEPDALAGDTYWSVDEVRPLKELCKVSSLLDNWLWPYEIIIFFNLLTLLA